MTSLLFWVFVILAAYVVQALVEHRRHVKALTEYRTDGRKEKL